MKAEWEKNRRRMVVWSEMNDKEKMQHILVTPIGVVPCNEKCSMCPIGGFKTCGDNVVYKRAEAWLKKAEQENVLDTSE